MIHHIENHIDRIRQKPDHKKRQYALFVSSCITVTIFMFWITSYEVGSNKAKNIAIEVASPIESVTASAGNAFQYVKDLIFGPSKIEYSSDNVEVLSGKI